MKLADLEKQEKAKGRVLPFIKVERTEPPKLLGPAPQIEGLGEGGRHLVCVENEEGHMEYMWMLQDGSLKKAEEIHNHGDRWGSEVD